MYKNFLSVFILLFFVSCSSTKVIDYWKSESIDDIKSKKILVINQFGDDVDRLRFEYELAAGLKSKGLDAVQANQVFPKLKPSEEIKKEDLAVLKQRLAEESIGVVVMTVVKEKQEYASTSSSGGGVYGAGMPYYPGYFGGGYYAGGFYGYYGSFYTPNYSYSSVTQVNKKYILETVVYDLSRDIDNQMVGAITLSVDNPTTLGASSKEVSQRLTRELTKKVQ
ncbi:hypothetical protein N9L20_03165 [Flavobacteriaceae bacterium]|nr:hypothetical protein [Flavobacteriaceae bacterium]